MSDKKNKFLEYLDKYISDAVIKEKELLSEDRKDESIHIKIKANVFQIFKTVFLFINKNKELTDEDVKPLFLEKLDTIPVSWRASYEAAKNHDDYEKSLIEEIKLQALSEIRSKFNRIWE